MPGPSATDDAPNACAERSTAPTLPGSWTPCRYTHSGPAGAGAHRSSYTASARVPELRPEALASSAGSTSTPARPLPAATYRSMGIQPLASAELQQILTLRDELPSALAPAAPLAELADLLELLRCGGW